MSKKTNRAVPTKKLPWLLIVVGIVVLGLLLTGGGFAFAATQEQNDAFCGSCHTQPESTFLQRSTAAKAVDLASYHTPKKVNCIDCHSGVGLGGRVSAELMGAHNALAWYTGTAVQPATLTNPIRDEACIKCHQAQTNPQLRQRNNHFHGFLARWQATDKAAGGCVSCHSGHDTAGSAATKYENNAKVQATCNACHKVMRKDD
jgi:nitrate/TMAO reductase-like tetraheme cytochrome c subunit